MQIDELFERDFVTFGELVAWHAGDAPERLALVDRTRRITYAALDRLTDRIGASLQRDGVRKGDCVAICAANSALYGAVLLSTLRIGAVVVPLQPTSTAAALRMMIADSGARICFLDTLGSEHLGAMDRSFVDRWVSLDGDESCEPFDAWLAPEGSRPAPVKIAPSDPFNIIYSSGTTGAPKGIVLSHAMRWAQVRRRSYGDGAVTLVSTPLYSNTTLVSFLPTIACGGTAILMEKFDARRFLELSQESRVTHAMLVPVQYRRLMDFPEFDTFDLSSYVMKFCTSAPFSGALKADVLRRWPGGLTEFYGMTEGGGTCMLSAHEHPDKLHTVGTPYPGHDIRLIGEDGREVGPGGVGEIVGRSETMMMQGYHNQPAKTADATWVSPEGLSYLRNGDVGRFDEDGFLVLMDRKKDMIISGGFNVYPSDLERELGAHPDVAESAVVGVASDRWGETPVAFVVLRAGAGVSAAALMEWTNARVGKTQRLSDLRIVEALPRSPIGKILKRDLRDAYQPAAG